MNVSFRRCHFATLSVNSATGGYMRTLGGNVYHLRDSSVAELPPNEMRI
jgi:hypothetical protein